MTHPIYRFGIFSVNPQAHLLTRSGVRLPLQEQPFQVLLALLENPGQVVSRETLRLRLWGTHTFVDFDQSLNSAVRRLRRALGDNPRAPTFIETLPRIGFRFFAGIATEPAGAPGNLLRQTMPMTRRSPLLAPPTPILAPRPLHGNTLALRH